MRDVLKPVFGTESLLLVDNESLRGPKILIKSRKEIIQLVVASPLHHLIIQSPQYYAIDN